jgi:hypothetical protein
MQSFSAAKTLASIPVASSSQGAGISPPPASGYFVDQKKGEVNELKQVSHLTRLDFDRLAAFKRSHNYHFS